MAGLGWMVLALVFLDEVLAMVGLGVWGWVHSPRALLVWLLPLLGMLLWSLFASPKARYGGPVVRPLVKLLVFGLAVLALDDAGHPRWALALLVFSVLINAVATMPSIRALSDEFPAAIRS